MQGGWCGIEAMRLFFQLLGLILLRLCELLLAGVIVGVITAIALLHYFDASLPEPGTLAAHRPDETTRIYARDGTTLLYQLFDGGQRTVVPLSDVPWSLRAATIAVEDAGFYTNPGVDLRGIVRAFYLNREGQIRSGGSTITQQLVRGVLLSPEERNEQSYRRKIREAILAYQLSSRFSKDQILAMYLNEIYYGNMAYGIEAASQAYFGHPARTLSLPEAALLAGLPQSPTDLNPLLNPAAAKARQKIVLDLMVKYGFVDRAQADAAYATKIVLRPGTVDLRYPHWVFYVRDLLEQQFGPDQVYGGGLRVITTLDPQIQDIAQKSARATLAELAQRNAHNAAVVVIDPGTSEILAMVGSADYNDASIDGQVNVALAPRQPGSTLKPIIYADALRQDWTPSTIIWDTPVDFGRYRPQNYDDQFHGPQRLRMALAGSLNIPAVRTLQHVGIDSFLDLAHAMGITTLQDRDRYGLAVALGAGEVRLLDLTNVYTTFANRGRERSPIALLRVTTSSGSLLYQAPSEAGTPVLGSHSEQIAYLITDILSDNNARTPIFGADSVMRLDGDRPAAVKTGTSNDWKDSWAIGYTPDLVVGVWVGNSDDSPMAEVAGANGAGLIWRTIMEQTHIGKPAEPFVQPPGIVEQSICAATGQVADGCTDQVAEHFLADRLPVKDPKQYVTVTVGDDGKCLATDATPPDQRRSVTFLLPPPDVRAWAADIPQPPSLPCLPAQQAHAIAGISTPLAVAAITSPRMNDVVGGTVTVEGSAAGQYSLSYGVSATPTSWTPIAAGAGGIGSGLLGKWTVDDLPDGVYTLRLIVALPGNPEQETRVVVTHTHSALTVRLVQPPPVMAVTPGTLIQIVAEASGPVARIDLLVDDQVVGTANGNIASVSWQATAGEHKIVAAAVGTDSKASVQSRPAMIDVR